MAAEEESLESLLNKATNPVNREENWEEILAFCDQINKELEGPQIAVRLLAHKMQSPQEREALLALSTLESCVKNCGKRFHQEIGKFRFLNEIIKIVSPKYLGNHTTEKVKKKCIELLYSWGQGLKSEPKILEAYQMLKRQGIVKQDPVYVDKTVVEPPSPRKNTIFEDEDKSKLLSRLLRSKHPEDLQAANRLIKNMVKQDAERMEKVSRRVQQIETVNNNIKVLEEMLQHYRPGSASDAEKDLMKELYENLEKARPNLFRLASDTEDKDNEGINEILKANDDVLTMMNKYKQTVEGNSSSSSNTTANKSGLIDMEGDKDRSKEASVISQLNQNDLDMLNEIFTTSKAPTEVVSTPPTTDIGLLNLSTATPAAPVLPAPISANPTPGSIMPQFSGQGASPQVGAGINWSAPTSQQNTAGSLFSGAAASSILAAPSPAKTAALPQTATTTAESKAFDAFEDLGKSLMQQSLSAVTVASTVPVVTQSLTLNQMATKSIPSSVTSSASSSSSATTTGAAVPTGTLLGQTPFDKIGGVISSSPAPTPPVSVTASPLRTATPAKTIEVKPMTDITIPLESIQPSNHPPVTAYEKNNVKVVIHLGKDSPREDVLVMVLSVMSTNTSSLKGFSFQAAVPKIMKVKLQPPSATDLPAYNPILPPTAITQVMLIANPLKEKIRLKFKLTYNIDGSAVTDVGDVDTFQVQ